MKKTFSTDAVTEIYRSNSNNKPISSKFNSNIKEQYYIILNICRSIAINYINYIILNQQSKINHKYQNY